MRIGSLALALPFLLAAASPTMLLSQFQEPTSEELKMTADPKAPDAAAVYLYREEATDDESRFNTFYERIKVLSEKGKELATVRVPYLRGYDTVTDIQGRTIHSDGTVVPLTDKPSDLMDYKVKDFQINSVVFTLPSVEVGSILEYRLKIRISESRVSAPTWEIQKRYFIHKARFSFHTHFTGGSIQSGSQAVDRLQYSSTLGPDAKVNYEGWKNLYSIDLTDIPAEPKDDWMPPLNSIIWRVEFYYTSAVSSAAFWEQAGKRWAEQSLEFTNPSAELKKAVAEIVGPGDTDLQKAQKIYAAVQKLDNTDFSRKRSEAERKKEKLKEIYKADDVWRDKSGSANQIALLYIALGRAAGLKIWTAQVVDRSRAMFDIHNLTVRQLDDYLAVLNLDGKELYLDPGQKMCPFGLLHWRHTLASGFRLTDNGPAPVTTPGISYKAASTQRVADLFIDPDGAVKGTVRFIMTGPDALYWRQVALENDLDEVQKRFKESLQDDFPVGVQAEFDHFISLGDYTVNLMAAVKVTGNIASATGKRFFLPGLFFESRAKHPFATHNTRSTPIDMHYCRTEQDDVTYHLPPGFTVESSPQTASASWPDHALLKISSSPTEDSVNVVRTLVYSFTLLGPADYPSLHDFYQKVATADQQQIVLARAASKGN